MVCSDCAIHSVDRELQQMMEKPAIGRMAMAIGIDGKSKRKRETARVSDLKT